MNETIKRVAEAMQQLPDENQNAIAQYIEAMLRLSNDTRQLMKEHLLEEIKEQEQGLYTSNALERLKKQYEFIQPDELLEYLRRYPFLIADLNKTYEIKCQYFDTSPMLLFYISDIGTLESATLAAYIKTETPREKAKDIFSQFEKEWWEDMSKDAKKRFMVDIINNV